ncbi:hypothetical protein DMA12_13115 [Amycolatopsis balhimycina DSM 5908]|uniref:Uncharacterized protein n=1 Tax=Amycolatopsis balhimycina DSM 5908 TaxID=1081091 RepID=A0A428WRZ5_AMYBA|nr:hypothetical protein DMA12_13115 [Amycolatopsis balhimycina DSM 5908]
MDSPDSWSKVPLAWERASGALFLSRQRGWTWRGVPIGSAAPERLIGHHTTGAHQDVVSIDLADEKMHTIGARFAPGDWGRPGAPPVRGPVDGPPDEVLLEVLEWPERERRYPAGN